MWSVLSIRLYMCVSPLASSMSSTMTRVVKPGETVCMSCNVPKKHWTTWFGQESNKTPFVIILTKYDVTEKEVLNKFLHGNNNGFTSMLENNGSISLTISNINEPLLGFYYCTSGTDKELTQMHSFVFGVYTEKLDGFSSGPPESSECHAGCSGQCWVLMAILCPLSAALVGLLAFILTWILHRKGKSSNSNPLTTLI
uniref:Ig-like domain-containing protein n=1 Tax=Esox lucius TaxID=8010 RepID=A0AAY5KRI3_ESOLU